MSSIKLPRTNTCNFAEDPNSALAETATNSCLSNNELLDKINNEIPAKTRDETAYKQKLALRKFVKVAMLLLAEGAYI